MERSAATLGRRVDHLGHPGRGGEPAEAPASGGPFPGEERVEPGPQAGANWLEPQGGEALAEEPPHVPEVGEPPEVCESEEARNQIDVMCALHARSQ